MGNIIPLLCWGSSRGLGGSGANCDLFSGISVDSEPGGGGVVLTYICMCRPMLKRRGLTELIKLKKWVLSER